MCPILEDCRGNDWSYDRGRLMYVNSAQTPADPELKNWVYIDSGTSAQRRPMAGMPTSVVGSHKQEKAPRTMSWWA
jgi:hypothetical protein